MSALESFAFQYGEQMSWFWLITCGLLCPLMLFITYGHVRKHEWPLAGLALLLAGANAYIVITEVFR